MGNVTDKLWQYQCQKEGSLFYYQYGTSHAPPPSHIIGRCPVCGSSRVKLTGREFPAVEECMPLPKSAGASC